MRIQPQNSWLQVWGAIQYLDTSHGRVLSVRSDDDTREIGRHCNRGLAGVDHHVAVVWLPLSQMPACLYMDHTLVSHAVDSEMGMPRFTQVLPGEVTGITDYLPAKLWFRCKT